MNYKVDITDGKVQLYSPRIGMNVMENATMDEVKIALATELEYAVKLDIVKLLMTFPHGFSAMDDTMIVDDKAMEAYEAWQHNIQKRVGFLDDYYASIDEKISEVLKQ